MTAPLTLTPGPGVAERAEAMAHRVGRRVGLDGVLADLGRAAEPVTDERHPDAQALEWEATDAETRRWWPQGLTTDAEAGHGAGHEGRAGVVLAAWYAKGLGERLPDVASRVSVLSLERQRYEHVLLVDPRRSYTDPRRPYRRVPVHAGGLAWFGDLLLVADTRRGVRVFDLRDLTLLRRPLGRHRYVLPQRQHWSSTLTAGPAPLRWSFLSVDASTPAEPELLAGEYARRGTPRLVRFPLAPLLADRPVPAAEVIDAGVLSMQGAARVDGTWWVSASRGTSRRGRLWYGDAGRGFTRVDDALPVGCEDLSYEAAGHRLWTQAEHPGRRLVVAVPLPQQ